MFLCKKSLRVRITFILLLSVLNNLTIIPNVTIKPVYAAGTDVKLMGNLIGNSTDGSEYKAFDGDTNTYFSAPASSYVGIDLGAGNETKVCKARIYPRGTSSEPNLTDNARGTFEGSKDGIHYTVLAANSSTIPYGQWKEFSVSNPGSFRYLRFKGVQDFDTSIQEVEFYALRKSPEIGVNLTFLTDWSPAQAFADLMKQTRPFGTASQPWVPLSLSPLPNEWPTSDFGLVFVASQPKMKGIYNLSFEGQATQVGRANSTKNVTITELIYNAATNKSTAHVNVADPIDPNVDETSISLAFIGVNPLYPVKNVKLLQPGYTESDTFTTAFKQALSPFSTIRTMDFTRTNLSTVRTWSDRITVNSFSQAGGVAWEYVIQLANELDKDLWINIPHLADDDYMYQLATLLKNNLEPDRKIYVEWSNEVWNSSFAQCRENREAAIAEVAEGNSLLNYPGETAETSPYTWAKRRVGLKIKAASDIFRSVFGDSEMMTRVRPILAGQAGTGSTFSASSTLEYALTFIADRFGSPKNYLYGISIAPYYNISSGASTTLSVDDLFTEMYASIYNAQTVWIKSGQNLAAFYGLKNLAYEGGPHLTGAESLDSKIAANRDPRMEDLNKTDYLTNAWYANGGDLFAWYNIATGYGSSGMWGLGEDLYDTNTPKWKAVKAIANSAPIDITFGKPLPSTIGAGNYDTMSGSTSDYGKNTVQLNIADKDYYNYTVRVDSPRVYKLYLTTATNAAGCKADVIVDGTKLTTLDIPMTGSNSTYQYTEFCNIPLSSGLHSINIQANAGVFYLKNVDVQYTETTPVPIPTATPVPTATPEPTPAPSPSPVPINVTADVEFNPTDGAINISGVIDPIRTATMMVFTPSDDLCYVHQQQSDDLGAYQFEYGLQQLETGKYTVRISGEDITNYREKYFYFYTDANLQQANVAITNAEKTRLTSDMNLAQQMTDALPASSDKICFQSRLKLINDINSGKNYRIASASWVQVNQNSSNLNVAIQNQTNSAKEVDIIAALYKGSTLIEVQKKHGTFEKDAIYKWTTPFADSQIESVYTVKIFIWDMSQLKPLIDVLQLE